MKKYLTLAVSAAFLTTWSAGMQRLMHALMQMKKIDIAALERAYQGK